MGFLAMVLETVGLSLSSNTQAAAPNHSEEQPKSTDSMYQGKMGILMW